jgi:hypothetical protein
MFPAILPIGLLVFNDFWITQKSFHMKEAFLYTSQFFKHLFLALSSRLGAFILLGLKLGVLPSKPLNTASGIH